MRTESWKPVGVDQESEKVETFDADIVQDSFSIQWIKRNHVVHKKYSISILLFKDLSRE